VEIQVLDSGVGIADEHLELIFQEFQRLPQSRATEAGLGLGLAIVERLCRLLAHPLRVQSVPDRGSVFALQLPVTAPEPVLPQLMLPALDKANASIWVIDNDATICQAMDTLLTSWGYQVQSGADAAAFSAQAKPDLLIVDYQLADGLLGTTVAQQLKSQAGFADLPVLMITANSQQQLAIELKQQGYQLLYKPVRPLQLKSMLRHLLLGV
jgi:CheY-like chemotaxis protein